MALMVSTIYLGARFVLFRPVHLGPRMLWMAILLPVVIGMISIFWADDPSLSGASLVKYAYTALCYFVALQFGRGWSHAALQRLLLVVLLSWLAGSIAMYLAVPGFEFFVPEHSRLSHSEILDLAASMFTRLGHPYLGQSNDYAPLLAFVGFILLGYARLHKSASAAIFAGLSFVACALTFSRGVAGAVLIGLAVYAVCIRASIIGLARAGIVAGFGVLLVWILLSDISVALIDRQAEIATVVESRLSADSIEERFRSYDDALRLIGERPFLGYGIGYYEAGAHLVSVHNAYLEQWRYFGVILGTLTSVCYLVPLAYFLGIRVRAPHIASWSDAIACGWLVLVMSSSVQTFFEASVPRAVIYLLLGLCVAMTGGLLRSQPRSGRTARTPFDHVQQSKHPVVSAPRLENDGSLPGLSSAGSPN